MKSRENCNENYFFYKYKKTDGIDPIPIDFEGVENLDTSEVTDMSYMFSAMHRLTSLDISTFDTSNVTDISQMFYGMSSLTSLDLSNFDTSKVTDMSHMFGSMTNLTSLDVSNFDRFEKGVQAMCFST